jgi:phosphoribosylformylglycinamidine synthase
MPKACVLFAAGTNCELETATALRMAGAEPEIVHVNALLRHETELAQFSLLVIPGGFSYGDYIASGRVLASEAVHHLKDDLVRFHAAGKLVMGICNGFQVLVKAGLLPAFERLFEPQSVTLDSNDSARYEDRWVWLAVPDSPCVFTQGLESPIELPVAHAEGKFLTRDPDTLARLQKGRQVALRYVTEDGEPAAYPDNPNGSLDGIAAVCDPTGRVFGLMPHPERFVHREHHPNWRRRRFTRIDGIRLFENAVSYARANC